MREPILLIFWKGFLRFILVSYLKRGRILSDSDEYIFYLFSPKQMLRCLFENWY